jgi:bla regulator protein blaR1
MSQSHAGWPATRAVVLAVAIDFAALALLASCGGRSSAQSAPRAEPAGGAAPSASATHSAPPADERDIESQSVWTYGARDGSELHFVLIAGDDDHTVSGNMSDIERARRHRGPGEHILWFRHRGTEYVVRDAGVLRQAKAIWRPVSELGARQGELGAQQGKLGAKQGALGAQQGKLGAKQGALGARLGQLSAQQAELSTRGAGRTLNAAEEAEIERGEREIERKMRHIEREMDELAARMRELGIPMARLGEQMDAVGEKMNVMGRKLERAATRARSDMRVLAERAIASGAAVAVR